MVVFEDLVKKLKQFGFTEYEAKAYIALVSEGILSAPKTATISRIPKSQIYNTLSNLSMKGMIEEFPGSPKKFKAKSPDNILSRFLLQRKENLKSLEVDAKGLKQNLNNFLLSKERTYVDSENLIWTVNGKRALYDKYAELMRKAKKEVFMTSFNFPRMQILEKEAKRCVRDKVILKGIASLDEKNKYNIKFYLNFFKEIRNYPKGLPLSILIIDNKECLYREKYETDNQVNYIGVHSYSRGLVEALTAYWKSLWENSKPIKYSQI